ncbi:MAG: hypothetical protein A3C55_06340 [Gammaproteobacteria bacterium RIFCSPHIGHO2_02_FULL_42_13]|nr:MAG: hypothetical protein A3C55_06340 [Gammaproteobacteria bacterium RIFCSPHIGHO2_02_FULL_42_13]
MFIHRIISGGQTGVDRAALDVAIEFNIPSGGWCPRGRRAEDGVIPERYSLQEADSSDYAVRTYLNVQDSDGTLILNIGQLTDGTKLTVEYARQLSKPYCIVALDQAHDAQVAMVIKWLEDDKIKIVNVAGPRGSHSPDISSLAVIFLRKLILSPGFISDERDGIR